MRRFAISTPPISACLSCLVLFSVGAEAGLNSPLAPEEELATFEFEDDLVAECVAAEPLVESPCAIAWDDQRRLYVVENRGYPNLADPPLGRIARLDDTDGDGRFDRRTDFATGLTFPNGLLRWRDGWLVTCAPDVLYLRDADGDGRADSREVMLTGFSTDQSTQLRVNDPTLRPGGWIAFAGGLSGGKVTDVRHGNATALDLSRNDLLWHPETGELRPIDGKSQWGHEFDDHGRRFLCMNRIQLQHVVIESRYLRRNPHLAFSDTVQDCPEELIRVISGGEPPAARIHPISENITLKDAHQGFFSAACAILLWRDGALPERFRGNAFCCDPSANIVHRDELVPNGATFIARRAPEKREMMASRDNWFRPVFLAQGPDGALHVVDMYRKVIDHPDYMPAAMRERVDMAAGRYRGRIWRVLLPRRHGVKPPPLETRPAWDSPDAGCRETWLREIEGRLAGDAGAREHAFALARDPDARVRFKAALSLGELGNDAALPAALASIARAGAKDRWTRAAVLSSAAECSPALLEFLLEPPDTDPDLLEEAARVVASAGNSRVSDVLNGSRFRSAGFDQRAALCAGFARLPDEAGIAAEAATAAADPARAVESRLRATRVLALDKTQRDVLRQLVNSREPDEVQIACIRALHGDTGTLLERARWLTLTSVVQEALIAALFAHGKGGHVIEAIESGAIPVAAINPARRDALMKDRTQSVAERARKLFAVAGGVDRMKVYEEMKTGVLALSGSAAAGRTVFAIHCATCHRLDQHGVAVGPDLFDIRNQPKEAILLHLIVPNREIYPGFNACTARLKDGRILSGLVASESPTAVTLRMAGGVQEVLLRRDILSVEASAGSLMPDGLEQTITARELADLLAHLRGE